MFEISAGGGNPAPKTSGLSGNFSRPIPPSGTSARKAYDKTVKQGTGAPKTITERLTGTYDYPAKSIISGIVGSSSSVKSGGSPRGSGGAGDSGGSGGSHNSSAKKALNYYEAPLAQLYGFNKATAYQEALANTAYRREMEDMRKAGLNPSVIYGSHNSSGADSGIFPRTDSAGGSGGSGGAGGYGRRSRGGNSGKYVFSGGAYYGTMAVVGTLVAAATKNVGAGMAAAGLTGTAMKALNGFLKK